MNQEQQALLQWLGLVTQTKIKSLSELSNPEYFLKVSQKIPQVGEIEYRKQEGWKSNYYAFKDLYEKLEIYIKNVLKSYTPSYKLGLVQMAQGEDNDGLLNFLKLLFVVCISCPQKQFFINFIMDLTDCQGILMKIFKENHLKGMEEADMTSSRPEDTGEKENLSQLYRALENLTAENESLQNCIDNDTQEMNKLKQTIAQLKKENSLIKNDLLQKIQLIKIKEQEDSFKSSTMAQGQEQILEELKRALYEQQEKHSKELLSHKQKNQDLQEKVAQLEIKMSEMDGGNMHVAEEDHSECVNAGHHKKVVSDYVSQVKQANLAEWKTRLENIRINNLLEELKENNEKLRKESANAPFKMSKSEGQNFKVEIMSRLRDRLKEKLNEEETKEKERVEIGKSGEINLDTVIVSEVANS